MSTRVWHFRDPWACIGQLLLWAASYLTPPTHPGCMLRCVVLGTYTCASNALYSTHRSQVAPVLSAPAVRVPSLSLASVASDWPVSLPFCLPRRRKLPFSLTPAHALPVVFYSWYVKMSMWIDFTLCSTPRYLP